MRLQGGTVSSAALVGRLPEVDLTLSNGLHIVSCMTAESDPAWGLIDRSTGYITELGVEAGPISSDEESWLQFHSRPRTSTCHMKL